MAVIHCPSCGKKVSDKAEKCSHCGVNVANLDEEKLALNRQIERVNASQKIMTWSVVAMLLFCGGFLFYYLDNVQPGTWQYYLSASSTVIGFIIYIVTRVQMVLLKHRSK